MKSLTHVATTAVLLGSGLLAACSEGESKPAAYVVGTPLFVGLEDECEARHEAVIGERRAGTLKLTEAPEQIHWAPDVHAAIERATKEDKPIFIASSVRKGGKLTSGCDV